MNLPEDFRFRSEFDLFCQVVNAAESMLKKGELYLLFGFEGDISFQYFLTDNEYASYGLSCPRREFERILEHEVVYLLAQRLMDENKVPRSLLRYLKEKEISETDANEITNLYVQKATYAAEHLLSEDAWRRFHFKAFTTGQKVSSIDWDICSYIFPGDQNQPYAQLLISVMDDLPDIGDNPLPEQCETVRFVCDSKDLDYLIAQLMQIKYRQQEEEKFPIKEKD